MKRKSYHYRDTTNLVIHYQTISKRLIVIIKKHKVYLGVNVVLKSDFPNKVKPQTKRGRHMDKSIAQGETYKYLN